MLIWSTSEDKSEHKNLRRTFMLENKDNCLNPNEIPVCTLNNAYDWPGYKSSIYVIHDPCGVVKTDKIKLIE
jgi:hypothetical protein